MWVPSCAVQAGVGGLELWAIMETLWRRCVWGVGPLTLRALRRLVLGQGWEREHTVFLFNEAGTRPLLQHSPLEAGRLAV